MKQTRSARSRGAIIGAGAAVLLATACASQPHERFLTVAPEPVPCGASTPSICIRVTDDEGDVWITRPTEFDGFTYEPGYTYRIQVREASEAEQIEAATVPRPKLIKIVSKEGSGVPDESVAANLGLGPWVLTTIGPSGLSADAWATSGITAVFDVAGGRVTGFAGCNDYTADLLVTGHQIQVTAPASTRKACAPETTMALEQEFLRRIAGATTFVTTDDSLVVGLDDDSGMAFAPR